MGEKVHFANVQLEIESEMDLTPIVDFLGDRVSIHFHGRWNASRNLLSLSLADVPWREVRAAELTVSALSDLVEGMPEDIRGLWDVAVSRRFDVGYESGSEGAELQSRFEAGTLERLSELGAELVITIYPLQESAQ